MLSRAEQLNIFPSDYPQNYDDYPWEHYEKRRGDYGVFLIQMHRDAYEEASLKSGFDPKIRVDKIAFFEKLLSEFKEQTILAQHECTDILMRSSSREEWKHAMSLHADSLAKYAALLSCIAQAKYDAQRKKEAR